MMKIVFELKNEDIPLKIRVRKKMNKIYNNNILNYLIIYLFQAIHCASNCCMNIQDLDIRLLIEFLTFECLLNEDYQKDYVYVMILNLIKLE